MHIALGYRYSGCAGGPVSNWVGAMAGMMGGGGAGGYGQGMMAAGEYGDRGNYPGTMMNGDSNISTPGIVLIALAAAAIGAAVGAVFARRGVRG